MEVAQRLLLFAALFLATASWFHAASPVEPGTVVVLDVDASRLRLVLAIRNHSGSTKLLLGSGVN